MSKTSPRIFSFKVSIVEIYLIKCTQLSKLHLTCSSSVLKMETLNIHIFLIFAFIENILGSFGTQDKIPLHAKCQVKSRKHCQVMNNVDISSAAHGTYCEGFSITFRRTVGTCVMMCCAQCVGCRHTALNKRALKIHH